MSGRLRPTLGVALLTLSIGAFAVLIGYSLLRIASIERDMRIEATQNMLWVISRAQVAALHLGTAGFEPDPDRTDQSALKRHHNVFLSRVNLLDDGPQRRRMEELGFAAPLDELRSSVFPLCTPKEEANVPHSHVVRPLCRPLYWW